MSIFVCIAGKNQIAVDALLFLINKGWRKYLMVCPNRTDNGCSYWQPSLIRFATEFDIPIVSLEQIQKIKELVFISLEFDQIVLPSSFLTRRLYNVHFSALPAYKGMYTSALPILHGCIKSGVTLHEIDYGIDTGPIVNRFFFDIPECWTARDLYFAYMQHGFNIFCHEIDNLVGEHLPESFDQPAKGGTYFSKAAIDYRNIKVNLRDTADGIVKQLRAFSFREYQTPKVNNMYIGDWCVLPERSYNKPGSIIYSDKNSLIVSTIDYNIKLKRFLGWDWFEFKAEDEVENLSYDFINVTDNAGWTPLIRAIYAGDVTLCRRLLECGANPNKSDCDGVTPLMHACLGWNEYKKKQFEKVLIEFGACPNKTDNFGRNINQYKSSGFFKVICK